VWAGRLPSFGFDSRRRVGWGALAGFGARAMMEEGWRGRFDSRREFGKMGGRGVGRGDCPVLASIRAGASGCEDG
jgi:hypothetical protein